MGNGAGFWDWIGLVLLFVIGALITFVLWPYYGYTFRFDPEELLSRFVDQETSMPMLAMRSHSGLAYQEGHEHQLAHYSAFSSCLQNSFIILLLEIVAWLISIAATPRAA